MYAWTGGIEEGKKGHDDSELEEDELGLFHEVGQASQRRDLI
jgi:hypothetical protein